MPPLSRTIPMGVGCTGLFRAFGYSGGESVTQHDKLFESFFGPAGAPEHLDYGRNGIRGCEYEDGDGPLTAMPSDAGLALGIGTEVAAVSQVKGSAVG